MFTWIHYQEHSHVVAEMYDEYGEVVAEVCRDTSMSPDEYFMGLIWSEHPVFRTFLDEYGELDNEYKHFGPFDTGLVGTVLEEAKVWCESVFLHAATGRQPPRSAQSEV